MIETTDTNHNESSNHNVCQWRRFLLNSWGGATWRARSARVWGPSGVQGQSPWSGGQGGQAPLKLKEN